MKRKEILYSSHALHNAQLLQLRIAFLPQHAAETHGATVPPPYRHKNFHQRFAPPRGPASSAKPPQRRRSGKPADARNAKTADAKIAEAWRMPARKEPGTQTARNPEVFNPAFHGSDEICQRRAAVSACKTTYRSNQMQTYAYLGEKTVGVGEEVEHHQGS